MSSNAVSNNKRIARNTLMLYFRMLLIMAVSFYTTRIVLKKLGIVDYGIYDAVGSMVMMLSFLNSSMSSATQRYLTYELGKGDKSRLSKTFSAALNIHIAIAVLIILLAEVIGVWFLNTKMPKIPADRLVAANWVLQFSILTCCTNVLQVPFNATLIAHEKMDIYAYISVVEAFLKLAIVFMLALLPFDKLIVYSILIFVVQCIVRGLYQAYCYRHYEECRFRLFWDKQLYKEMTSFAGWNVFGSLAWMARGQGISTILFMFIGPAVNAARGLASHVSATLSGFVSNFTLALNPQITKNYATGDIQEMETLTYRGLKFSYFLLFLLAFPIAININYLLGIWLVDVPEYTAIFLILILVDTLVGNLFGTPLMTALMATGRIKRYQIVVSLCLMAILPLAYVALYLGYSPVTVFVLSIVVTLIAGIVRFLFCSYQIGFSISMFVKQVLLPVFCVTMVAVPVPLLLKHKMAHETILSVVLTSLIALVIGLCSIMFLGLTTGERTRIYKIILSKIKK